MPSAPTRIVEQSTVEVRYGQGNPPPSPSVIILTWNGRRWLQACLDAVIASTLAPHEIIVVDNASDDGTVDYLRAAYPRVTTIALERNIGFAAGNNAGARAATGEYLVFLNNDTVVAADWLRSLVASVGADATIGLVSSRVVYMDRPDVVDSAGDGYLRCGGAFKHAHGRPVIEVSGSREVFSACGAGLLIRRELFSRLGGFDDDFFMVYEDVDLSYRARLLGARCVYAHDAIVHHAGSASIGRGSDVAVFHGQRNLEWTWIKNTPSRLLWRSAASHVLYGLAAAVGYAAQGQLWTWCRAKAAALGSLAAVLRKRCEIQRSAVVDPDALWRLMTPRWWALKRREKQFDFTVLSRDVNPDPVPGPRADDTPAR